MNVNDELETMWNKVIEDYFMVLPSIYMDELRKTT